MSRQTPSQFASVYGPVKSWRYGQSLGIDPIGSVSHCSFNCVYCQLGEIERISCDRRLFITTEEIISNLREFSPWDVEVITMSGSGEPTLALNLGEILLAIKQLTAKPTLVLTNGTLLNQPQVRKELNNADKVSVKLDAFDDKQLRRINRPMAGLTLEDIVAGIEKFRQEYQGELAIQTMILNPWHESSQNNYLNWLKKIQPSEIQLNTPTRPKPLTRQLEGRGNHSSADSLPYAVRVLKCVSPEILKQMGDRINLLTGIKVRYANYQTRKNNK